MAVMVPSSRGRVTSLTPTMLASRYFFHSGNPRPNRQVRLFLASACTRLLPCTLEGARVPPLSLCLHAPWHTLYTLSRASRRVHVCGVDEPTKHQVARSLLRPFNWRRATTPLLCARSKQGVRGPSASKYLRPRPLTYRMMQPATTQQAAVPLGRATGHGEQVAAAETPSSIGRRSTQCSTTSMATTRRPTRCSAPASAHVEHPASPAAAWRRPRVVA